MPFHFSPKRTVPLLVCIWSLVLLGWLPLCAETDQTVESSKAADPSKRADSKSKPAAPAANAQAGKQAGARTDSKAATDQPALPPKKRIRYRPPADGIPAARLTGGSRGDGDKKIRLDVLTPEEVAFTTQEQPSLFWSQSKPAEAQFELTLLAEGEPEPLVHVQVKESAKAGIQRLRLADHGIKLKPGVEYKWNVALIAAPESRSKDLFASSVIKRVDPSPELKSRLQNTTAEELAAVYAEAGYWYDSLAALSDQIESHPNDPDWVAARTELLHQVGLDVTVDP